MKKPTNFACVRPKAGWSLIKSVLSARSLYLFPCGRGYVASLDAIRVRGCDLSLGRNPSPQPSPPRGEGARCRCFCASIQSHHALTQRYHMGGGCRRVKLVDQGAAMIQYRALVDRA